MAKVATNKSDLAEVHVQANPNPNPDPILEVHVEALLVVQAAGLFAAVVRVEANPGRVPFVRKPPQ